MTLGEEKSRPFLSESLKCVQLIVSLYLSANRSLVIISPIQTANKHTVLAQTHTHTHLQNLGANTKYTKYNINLK